MERINDVRLKIEERNKNDKKIAYQEIFKALGSITNLSYALISAMKVLLENTDILQLDQYFNLINDLSGFNLKPEENISESKERFKNSLDRHQNSEDYNLDFKCISDKFDKITKTNPSINSSKLIDYLFDLNNQNLDFNISLALDIVDLSLKFNNIIYSFEEYPEHYHNFLFLLFLKFSDPISDDILEITIQNHIRKRIENKYLKAIEFNRASEDFDYDNIEIVGRHESDYIPQTSHTLNLAQIEYPDINILLTQVAGSLTKEALESMYISYCDNGKICVNLKKECSNENAFCVIFSLISTIIGFDGGVITGFPNPLPHQKIISIQIQRGDKNIEIIDFDHHDKDSSLKDSTIKMFVETIIRFAVWLENVSNLEKTVNNVIEQVEDHFKNKLLLKKECAQPENNLINLNNITTANANSTDQTQLRDYLAVSSLLKVFIEPAQIVINYPDPDTLLPVSMTLLTRKIIFELFKFNDSTTDFASVFLQNLRTWLLDQFDFSYRNEYGFDPDSVVEIIINNLSIILNDNIDYNQSKISIISNILLKIYNRLWRIFYCISEIDKSAGAVLAQSFEHKINYFVPDTDRKSQRVSIIRAKGSNLDEFIQDYNISNKGSGEDPQSNLELHNLILQIATCVGHIHDLQHDQMERYNKRNPLGGKLLTGHVWQNLANCFAITNNEGLIDFQEYKKNNIYLGQSSTKSLNYTRDWKSLKSEKSQNYAIFYSEKDIKDPDTIRTRIGLLEDNLPFVVVVYKGVTKGMIGTSSYTIFGIGENIEHVARMSKFLSFISSYICGLDVKNLKSFFGDGQVVQGCRTAGLPIPEKYIPEAIEWYIKMFPDQTESITEDDLIISNFEVWLKSLQKQIVTERSQSNKSVVAEFLSFRSAI